MTFHDPQRAAAVKVSTQAKSSAYERAKSGSLAVSAHQLRDERPSTSPRNRKAQTSQWFPVNQAILERYFQYGEPIATCAADLKISEQQVQAVVDQAIAIGKMKIGLTFQNVEGRYDRLKSDDRYPVAPKRATKRQLAKEIADRLDKVVSKNRQLVREGVMAYVSMVQADNRIVLLPSKEPHQIQAWMKLVHKLKIRHLDFRFTGLKVGGEKGNLKEQFKRLGIPRPSNVVWVNAHNQDSRAELKHLAIDVVYRSRGCGIFRYVMAVAAISQPWLAPAPLDMPVPEMSQEQPEAIDIAEEPTPLDTLVPETSAEQAEANDNAEQQGALCCVCNTPLPSDLTPRTGEDFDGNAPPVFMHFVLNRSGKWCCHFLEGNLRRGLKRTLTFDEAKVREAAKRGGADATSGGEQLIEEGIAMGRGGVWMNFTNDQYATLLSDRSAPGPGDTALNRVDGTWNEISVQCSVPSGMMPL
jgi:hypothetical protein